MSLEQFSEKVYRLLPVVMREFSSRQNDELLSGKISLPQFFIMDYLKGKETAKMTDLAKVVNVTTAAMTGMIGKLVAGGYCERLPDPDDRRVIRVRLLAKGSELVKKISQKRRRTIENIFGQIDEKDRMEYLRILARIHDVMVKEKEASS